MRGQRANVLGISGLLLAASFIAASSLVAFGGEDPETRWRCPYTQDGACVPNPRTYGYYATRWRRWPEAPPAVPPEKPAFPKPAQPEASDANATNPETPPGNPSDSSNGPLPMLEPAVPRETAPPLREQPTPRVRTSEPTEVMPPSSRTTPVEPGLPPELEQMPAQPDNLDDLIPDAQADDAPAPPMAEPEKIPADEDPFKDDPLPSEGMPDGTGVRRRSAGDTARDQAMRWRKDPRLQLTAASGAAPNPVRPAVAIKPQATAPVVRKQPKPAAPRQQVSRENPLRDAGFSTSVLPSPAADGDVTQVSGWTSETPVSAPPVNPLRAAR